MQKNKGGKKKELERKSMALKTGNQQRNSIQPKGGSSKT